MAAATPSDEDLLAAARSGDRQAIESLLERHESQIYRFGLKMCRDPEDAKDVLQDTLFAMVRSVRDFRGASSTSTWLYAIARSFCIKKRRRSKFAPDVERSLDTEVKVANEPAPRGEPDEALARKQMERALESAIGALEPMYREVLVLRDGEGLTAAEVAEVLGVSVQAVKSRLHRARLAVRERLAPSFGLESATRSSGACPDILTMFSQHIEDEISGERCAELERHLDGCVECREKCESLRRTLALCRAAGSGSVPESVQASLKGALRAAIAEARLNPFRGDRLT